MHCIYKKLIIFKNNTFLLKVFDGTKVIYLV